MYIGIGDKVISKERLLEVLKDVPDGAVLSCNSVENLAVCSFDREQKQCVQYLGYLDIAEEGYIPDDRPPNK